MVGLQESRVAPAMLWAGACLGPTLPTVYHRLVVGGENGHGFSPQGKPVVFGSWVPEVTGVAPVNVHAPEV